jgi:antitoxin MazE
MSMKVELIRVGNSRGIRLPKAIIEQCGFEGKVELTVQGGVLEVRAAGQAREGWDEAFARMHAAGDDRLDADAMHPTSWDLDEWRW